MSRLLRERIHAGEAHSFSAGEAHYSRVRRLRAPEDHFFLCWWRARLQCREISMAEPTRIKISINGISSGSLLKIGESVGITSKEALIAEAARRLLPEAVRWAE